MARTPIPTWFFVVVIVRHEHRILLVQEAKHEQSWYFPAGRVEEGETLIEAAERETMEEAGIAVRVDGIVRFEHSLIQSGARVRTVMTASPLKETEPKRQPDKESLKADWFSPTAAGNLRLRGREVLWIIEYLSSGGSVSPISILAEEGSGYSA
jgi:phosphatase NudJ